MLAVRWTWQAKANGARELVEAIKAYPAYGLPEPPHGVRIYGQHPLGRWHEVSLELEFESLTEYEAWFHEFSTAPRFSEWVDLRRDLYERGGHGEVRSLEQFG